VIVRRDGAAPGDSRAPYPSYVPLIGVEAVPRPRRPHNGRLVLHAGGRRPRWAWPPAL